MYEVLLKELAQETMKTTGKKIVQGVGIAAAAAGGFAIVKLISSTIDNLVTATFANYRARRFAEEERMRRDAEEFKYEEVHKDHETAEADITKEMTTAETESEPETC